jgi:SAM-dependent methyltransferase
MMEPNRFSQEWYRVFADSIPASHTEREVAFIQRHLPRERYPRILDLCCGTARHTAPLSRAGYQILGVDRNETALATARVRAPAARFMARDLRELASLSGPFDGCINLWQSFGYFDEATNLRVLGDLLGLLRPGGRFIIDVYNRQHFETLPLTEEGDRAGQRIRTTRSWKGPRLTVTVTYQDGGSESSEWHLYSPEELTEAVGSVGFEELCRCAWFDEATPVSVEHARMQFVFQIPA